MDDARFGEHARFWGPVEIQEFWSGEAFARPDEGQSLSYELARFSVRSLAGDFPHYGWERNKGYGAPAHLKALANHGVTPHHRKSFAPIHNMLYADSP